MGMANWVGATREMTLESWWLGKEVQPAMLEVASTEPWKGQFCLCVLVGEARGQGLTNSCLGYREQLQLELDLGSLNLFLGNGALDTKGPAP